jgi:PAS domain-containing protein
MSHPTSDPSAAELVRLRRRVTDLEQQLDTLLTTKQEDATKQLLQSLSLVEAAFESTADGILVVDLAGRITRWNQRFAQLWHTPLQFLESGDDHAVLAHGTQQLRDPASFFEQVRDLYSQPEAESFDVLDFADGRVFERYSCPQRIGTTIVGRVWCFRDVTARARAEHERMRCRSR